MKKTLSIAAAVAWSLGGACSALADAFYREDGKLLFEMEFVTIGDPGNPDDPEAARRPAGGVDYEYRIGKFEVSLGQVRAGGFSGEDYLPQRRRPTSKTPIEGFSWEAMARFVNGMNTVAGHHPAYKFSIQPGELGYDVNAPLELWAPGDLGYDPENPYRNRLAYYFLPSYDEWYKAAFYDPVAEVYYDYPTGSDMPPAPVVSGTAPNTVVYGNPDPVTGSADIDQAGGLSPYGVMGMGGNVSEALETQLNSLNDDPAAHKMRIGGRYDSVPLEIIRSASVGQVPFGGGPTVGFRVASVPEPSALVTAALGALGLLLAASRRAAASAASPPARSKKRWNSGVQSS